MVLPDPILTPEEQLPLMAPLVAPLVAPVLAPPPVCAPPNLLARAIGWGLDLRRRVLSYLASLVVNLVLLLLLALWIETHYESPGLPPQVIICQPIEAVDPREPLTLEMPLVKTSAPQGTPLEPDIVEVPAAMAEAPAIIAPVAGYAAQPIMPEEELPQQSLVNPQTLLEPSHLPVGGGLQGRNPKARGRLVAERGGTLASETAVDRGLVWLAAHQREDGSWRFNHQEQNDCKGQCNHPGTVGTSTGATGLALLPFLGAGNTPQQGEHRQTVQRGLAYLQRRMMLTPHGGDLQEGTMYAQGIATIALCEAYTLTGDEGLKKSAQKGIDFIGYAQHPAGGWRYYPGQAGDTTVTGWQLMALKSGQLAGLTIPSPTLARSENFLDHVQSRFGTVYGYQLPGEEATPTAIALLSRMYFGWTRHDERLRVGIERLEKWGPSHSDMYFNYYATQAMNHYGGPRWETWNETLREHLIATQNTSGHAVGSWYFGGKQTLTGGRLCETALTTMILEVYYRHMPLYDEAAGNGF